MDTPAVPDAVAPAQGTTDTETARWTKLRHWWSRVAVLVAVLAFVVGGVFGWRW
jgi:predicted negative regulator of RcsB-dependent stress response